MPEEKESLSNGDGKTSRRELERQVDELKRERIRVEENIKRMEVNQKRAAEMAAKRAAASPPKEASGDAGSPNGKRKREKSSDGERDGSDKEKEKDKEKDEGKEKDKDKDSDSESGKRRRKEKETKKPGKTDKRSRAMFGMLVGHLQSAKSRLETEKGWKSADLRRKAQERLEHKIELQKLGIQDLKKSHFDQSKKDEEEKLQLIDRTIEEKELLLLQTRLESHYSAMMNFIRTKAEPTIFYLPAKHTRDSEKMLEETQEAIKRKIETLKVELQPLPAEDQAAARARASAAAAAEAAVDAEAKAADDDEEEPSIPPEAPQNAAEAEAAEKADEDKEDAQSSPAEAQEDGASEKAAKSDEEGKNGD